MRFGISTDVGRWRDQNEDAFLCDDAMGLFIVADGMGGHSGGEVASSMAVHAIHQHLVALGDPPMLSDLHRAIELANELIFERAHSDRRLLGMGTTVVLAHIMEQSVTVLHVGDSRAYRLTDEEFVCLTADHTLVSQLVREGKMTPHAAKQHPNRSALLRAVGVDRTVKIDSLQLHGVDGLLLLCTDGLTEMLDDESMAGILRSIDDPQAACEQLIIRANEEGGRDNSTVIIIRLEEEQEGTGG